MFKNLKINSALLICSAFIFRLLFLNVCNAATFNSLPSSPAKYAAITSKTNNDPEVSATPDNFRYQVAEMCEEELNEEDGLKSTSLLFIQILYCDVADKLSSDFKSNLFFSTYFPQLLSERYLFLRVFRI